MRKRTLGLLAALALCLVLLPGTALAEGDPGVSIGGTALERGKQYVAGGYDVIEKPADAPADTPYLDYRDGVLTVHGQMDLKSSSFLIDGAVTFTGGGDSCLETGSIHFNNGTLTLSGSMDFKPQGFTSNYSTSSLVSKLTTTDDYSGDIAIQGTSTSVLLDVQSSASISIGGNVSYFSSDPPTDPITLKSAGDISTNMLQYHTITIEGKNVSLMHSPVFTGKSLTVRAAENVTVPNCAVLFLSGNYTEAVSVDISAGGNVEITNNGILMQAPPDGRTDSLTIRDAKSVSIQGKTNEYNPSLLPVSVTFVNCGSVTVTDTGNGEILKEGVPVTSDCPWTATAGGKTVTIPSGTWTYAGDAPTDDPYFLDKVSGPTCWKAGEGWMFYERPASEGAPAKLTLDGASYEEPIYIQDHSQPVPVQLELKGENAVKKLGADALTLTGNGGFTGTIDVTAFTNSSTATLNAVVIVSAEEGGVPTIGQTVYGNRSTADLSGGQGTVQEHTPITITNGATLTILQDGSVSIYDLEGLKNHGTIVNQGAIVIDSTGSLGTPNFGTIVNNGEVTIYPPEDVTEEETSAFIKGMGLSGTGTVTVQKTVNGNQVTETYTNSGLKLLDPVGTLDLRDADSADTTHWEDLGYKWEVLETDPDNTSTITKAKLTLAPGFNANEVTLPDAAVTIVSEGECVIGELTVNNPQKTELTFSGAGPLTVREHINLSGGHENSVTVAGGAVVVAKNGITVCADGAVDGLVTVNGTLIAENSSGAALRSGNVVVGGSGTLKVSGHTGVVLGGKSGQDFHGAFTIQPGGRLEADCTNNTVEAYIGVEGATFEGYEAGDILVIPSGYVPRGYEPRFNEGKTVLLIPGGGPFTISSDNVPRPPVSGHTHRWAEDWTTSATHHWHACTASGCPVTENSGKDGYGAHVYDGGWDTDCNVCGYTRSLPSSEPSEPSGGGSSSSGGGGASRPTSPITVEPSEHGTVTSDRAGAVYGAPVTLTVLPDSGYRLESLTATDSRGYQMSLSSLGGGKYAFTMPGGPVTVRAAFAALEEGCPSRAFSDLDTGAWYHEAVVYVLQNGLMGGYGNGRFGPDNILTRAQFAQILYNREGRPAVTGGEAFTDVSSGAWCAEAVAWTAERGVVSGYGGGLFGPDDPITREQLAVMLWRYAGSPAASGGELRFHDADQIEAHARDAMCWAVENGVMNGKGGGILAPKGLATRAQAAQMLKNFLKDG